MNKNKNYFNRYEKKYLLNKEQSEQVKQEVNRRMILDEYGRHQIHNIYLDTDSFQLIQTSLEKPLYKEKFRIRGYGDGLEMTTFIEMKKKYKGIVYKRRTAFSQEEITQFVKDIELPESIDNQIMNELIWAQSRYHFIPKMYIGYQREAYFQDDSDDIRITFDDHIRWRTDDLELAAHEDDLTITDKHAVLMEVKVADAMPLWLTACLNVGKIYPLSFSKYGACYKQMIESEDHKRC